MDRTQVLEQLAPITDMTVRPMEHTPATRVVVTPEMVTLRPGRGARTMEVTPEGFLNMVQFVEMPRTLAGRLSPNTLATATTELLEKKGNYDLVLRNSQIIGFTRPHEHRALAPERVLRAIEAGIGSNIDYHRVGLVGYSADIEVLGVHEVAVSQGDLVQAGAMVRFSPIGSVLPTVQSYVLRLACTNGVTSMDILREFTYGGEGDDVWQFFRQSVRDAYRAVERIAHRWRQLQEQQIAPGDRAMVLEAMLKEAGITGKDAQAVRVLALESPPQNAYEVMNLVTYASSHILQRADQVRRALDTAANFALESTHRRECPVCHRRR